MSRDIDNVEIEIQSCVICANNINAKCVMQTSENILHHCQCIEYKIINNVDYFQSWGDCKKVAKQSRTLFIFCSHCFNFPFIKTLCNNNYILGVIVNCKDILLEKRKVNLLHVSFFRCLAHDHGLPMM